MEEPDRQETVKVWLRRLQQFLRIFFIHGITPVFIFDGKYPEQKKNTQKNRKEQKEKVKTKITEFKDKLKGLDIFDHTPDMLDQLKKLMSRDTYLSSNDISLIKNVLSSIGIPVLDAVWESEQLCSMLCIENQIDAVFSTDTDNLTYGCPVLITGFTRPILNPQTNIIRT